MEYIVLDLEFNAAYSKTRHRFVNEIIEFGAVKLDEQLNIIDKFSELVTPQISKKLNTHVAALTHITIDELNQSHNSFSHVMSKFRKFLGDGVLMSWSNSDILVLAENYRYFFGNDKMSFLKYYVNLQKYCQRAIGYTDRSHQMGLAACAEQLGLGFEDNSLHRAYNDAELTAECFKALYGVLMGRIVVHQYNGIAFVHTYVVHNIFDQFIRRVINLTGIHIECVPVVVDIALAVKVAYAVMH